MLMIRRLHSFPNFPKLQTKCGLKECKFFKRSNGRVLSCQFAIRQPSAVSPRGRIIGIVQSVDPDQIVFDFAVVAV